MSVKFVVNFKKPKRIETREENGFYFKDNGGPIVILIHGLTGTPNEMRFVANFLNKKGYNIVCPKLANHDQPIEILKDTKWQEFYESVRTAFLKADSENNHSPIFVAGLSMGALLALLLAEEFPNRISGVSCLSPTLFYDGWNVPWTRHLLHLVNWNPLKNFFYFKEEAPYGIKNETIRQRIYDYYQQADLNDLSRLSKYGYPYFPVTLLCELQNLVKHLTKKLPNVHVPVQMLQAKNDDVTSVKNSQFIYDRISSQVKEIFLLHNSYHVITADDDRETVAEKIDEFFSRAKNHSKGINADGSHSPNVLTTT